MKGESYRMFWTSSGEKEVAVRPPSGFGCGGIEDVKETTNPSRRSSPCLVYLLCSNCIYTNTEDLYSRFDIKE